MKTKELRNKILEASDSDWFNSVETNLEFKPVKIKLNFIGFTDIHKFLETQERGWNKLGDELPDELNQSRDHFTALKELLENFLERNIAEPVSSLNTHWNQPKGNFDTSFDYFTYESPEVKFLIELNNSHPDSVSGAYKYLLGGMNLTPKSAFVGAVLAYEFEQKDHTGITSRRNKEKSSISRLRNDFTNQLTESETQLAEHLKKNETDFHQHLSNSKEEYSKHIEKIDEFKGEKESLFDDWFKESKEGFGEFDK